MRKKPMEQRSNNAGGMLEGLGVAGGGKNDSHPEENGKPVEDKGTEFGRSGHQVTGGRTKLQIPSSKLQRNSKFQVPSGIVCRSGCDGARCGWFRRHSARVRNLELLWSLGLGIWSFPQALSPTWKRTKRRIVMLSPSCLATEPTCSFTETSELRLTNPWSTRQ